MLQPHGPVAPRSRGRSTSSRTNEEDIKPQPQAPPSAQPNHHDDDEEVPLARVRDDALARKACFCFAYLLCCMCFVTWCVLFTFSFLGYSVRISPELSFSKFCSHCCKFNTVNCYAKLELHPFTCECFLLVNLYVNYLSSAYLFERN